MADEVVVREIREGVLAEVVVAADELEPVGRAVDTSDSIGLGTEAAALLFSLAGEVKEELRRRGSQLGGQVEIEAGFGITGGGSVFLAKIESTASIKIRAVVEID